MNWKKFKEEVENKLIASNCSNPDLAEIEGIDFKPVFIGTNSIEILSYYADKNSFYIVS